MPIIRKLFEFIVFSNIWIALAAAGLTANTYLILGKNINLLVIALIFFSTFSVYNLQRLIKHYFQKKNYNNRHFWISNHHLSISLLTVVSSISALIIFFYLYSFKTFIFLLPFSLTSVLYAVSLFNKKALRDLPLLKIFLIAATWSVSSVILPIIDLDMSLNLKIIILISFNFLFIFALTIPFDIRDLKLDHIETKTIPQVIGVGKSILLSLSFLLICSIIALITSQSYLMIPLIICFVLISQTKKEMPELFYSGILDGTILLFPLISFLFN